MTAWAGVTVIYMNKTQTMVITYLNIDTDLTIRDGTRYFYPPNMVVGTS